MYFKSNFNKFFTFSFSNRIFFKFSLIVDYFNNNYLKIILYLLEAFQSN